MAVGNIQNKKALFTDSIFRDGFGIYYVAFHNSGESNFVWKLQMHPVRQKKASCYFLVSDIYLLFLMQVLDVAIVTQVISWKKVHKEYSIKNNSAAMIDDRKFQNKIVVFNEHNKVPSIFFFYHLGSFINDVRFLGRGWV